MKGLSAGLTATTVLLASVALFVPASAAAKNCGEVAGAHIVTHGGVSCRTAGTVYTRFRAGRRLPSGWICGLSAGACSKGRQGFTFRFIPRDQTAGLSVSEGWPAILADVARATRAAMGSVGDRVELDHGVFGQGERCAGNVVA